MSVPVSQACSPAAMQLLWNDTITQGMPAAWAWSIAACVHMYRVVFTV